MYPRSFARTPLGRSTKTQLATAIEISVDQPVVRLNPSSNGLTLLTGTITLPRSTSRLESRIGIFLTGTLFERGRKTVCHEQSGTIVRNGSSTVEKDSHSFQFAIPSTIPISQRVELGTGISYTVTASSNGANSLPSPINIIADHLPCENEAHDDSRVSVLSLNDLLGPISFKLSAVGSDGFTVSSLAKTSISFLSPPGGISIIALTTTLVECTTVSPPYPCLATSSTKPHTLFRLDGTLPSAFSRQLYHPSSLTAGAALPNYLQEAFRRKSLRKLEEGQREDFVRVSRLPKCATMRAGTKGGEWMEIRFRVQWELIWTDKGGRKSKAVVSSEPFQIASCLSNTFESIPPPYSPTLPAPTTLDIRCACTIPLNELVESLRGAREDEREVGREGGLMRKLSRESM